MEFVLIPPGIGKLGERCELRFEFPKPFYLSRYPVTQEQYLRVTGSNPSYFKGDLRRPVESVSWHDATAFAKKIGCRLPYEAEWEYACRAWTATRFALGDDWRPDWGNVNSSGTTPVGQFLPNYWGVFDSHGNVWEWCFDAWSERMRPVPVLEGEQSDPFASFAAAPGSATLGTVAPPTATATLSAPASATTASASPSEGRTRRCLRGGSWFDIAGDCRSAYRYWLDADSHNDLIGFRLVFPLG